MARRGRWSAWLVVLALGAGAAPAQDASGVQLRLEGSAAEREALEASLRELLSRLPVALVPAGDGPALARVEVALGDPECTVSIVDRAGTVVVSRRLLRSPSSAVTLEAVATVVYSAVAELAEQERHPLSRRVLLPAPVTAEQPGGAAPTPALVELGAFLAGRSFGAEALTVFGGGLWLGVRLKTRGAWTPRLALHASWFGPFDSDPLLTVMQISLQTISLRLLGGVRLSLGPTLSLEGSLGAGVDAFALEGHSALPRDSYFRQRLEGSPVVGALLGVRLALSGPATLLLGATADLDLLPRRYVTDVDGVHTVLFETWRLRPGLMAGFTFDLGGAP